LNLSKKYIIKLFKSQYAFRGLMFSTCTICQHPCHITVCCHMFNSTSMNTLMTDITRRSDAFIWDEGWVMSKCGSSPCGPAARRPWQVFCAPSLGPSHKSPVLLNKLQSALRLRLLTWLYWKTVDICTLTVSPFKKSNVTSLFRFPLWDTQCQKTRSNTNILQESIKVRNEGGNSP
jgi:hypothetical protein